MTERGAQPGQAARGSDEAAPDARSLGSDVVLALYRAIKSAQMHALENQAVRRQLEATTEVLRVHHLKTGGHVSLLFARGAVFFGGQPLRASRGTYEAAMELGTMLDRCGGAELLIAGGIPPAEVRAFVVAVVTTLRDPTARFGDLAPPRIRLRAVSDAALLRGLDVEELAPDDRVVRTYASAVVLLRRLFEDLSRGKPILPRRIKRVAQGLVDLSAGDTPAFLGVTQVRNANHDDAGRAVNVAILAVAMGRQLETSRVELSRIAMAAMLHDVGRPRALRSQLEGDDAPIAAALDATADRALPAGTAAVLTALGGVNDPSIERGVIAYEAVWLPRTPMLGPVYGGARTPTLQARIVAMARAYNELLTPVPGEPARSAAAALAELDAAAQRRAAEGDTVERTVLRLLIGALGVLPPGTLVLLSTGDTAVVLDGESGRRVRVVLDSGGGVPEPAVEIELGDDRAPSISRVVGTDPSFAARSNPPSGVMTPPPITPAPRASVPSAPSVSGVRSAPMATSSRPPQTLEQPSSPRTPVPPPSRPRPPGPTTRIPPMAPTVTLVEELGPDAPDFVTTAELPAAPTSLGAVPPSVPPAPLPTALPLVTAHHDVDATVVTPSPFGSSDDDAPQDRPRMRLWTPIRRAGGSSAPPPPPSAPPAVPSEPPPRSAPPRSAPPDTDRAPAIPRRQPPASAPTLMLPKRPASSPEAPSEPSQDLIGTRPGPARRSALPSSVPTLPLVQAAKRNATLAGFGPEPAPQSAPPPSSARSGRPAGPASVAPSRPPDASGTMERAPLAHLLVHVVGRGLTGTLLLRPPTGEEHALSLAAGVPQRLRTTSNVSPLGDVLVRLGALAPADVDGAVLRATMEGELLGRQLVHEGISEAIVLGALRTQLGDRVATLANLSPKTAYAFYANVDLLEAATAGSTPCDPLAVVMTVVRSWSNDAWMDGLLSKLAGSTLALHAAAEPARFGLSETEHEVVESIRAGWLPYTDLLAAYPDKEGMVRRVLYALAITKHLDVGQPGAWPLCVPPRSPRAPTAAVIEDSDTDADGDRLSSLPVAIPEGMKPPEPRRMPPQSAAAAPTPVRTPVAPAPPAPPPSGRASFIEGNSVPEPEPPAHAAQVTASEMPRRPVIVPYAVITKPPPGGRHEPLSPRASAAAQDVEPPSARTSSPDLGRASSPDLGRASSPDLGRASSPDLGRVSSSPGPMRRSPDASRSSSPDLSRDDDAPPSRTSILPPVPASGPDVELRARITRLASALATATHYELLGVGAGASPVEIQPAYLQMVKLVHPDRIPESLADLRDAAAKIFARVTEARDALTDPTRKREYDARLISGKNEADEAAIVSRILDANGAYQRAEILMKRGDNATAEQLAQQAVDGDPDQPDHLALLGWLRAMRSGANNLADGISLLDRAVSANPESDRNLYFRGVLLKRAGRGADAVRDFRKAVELNPKNLDAVREVRLHQMRSGEAAGAAVSKGLFDKLFTKKK